jgi:hypothetical protein
MIEKTTIVTDAETPEAFAEDRLEFWQWFTKMVMRAATVVAVILVVLAYFTL